MSEEAGAQRWRNKPVVVEAKQWLKHGDHSAVRPYETAKGWIETLEGGHIVNPGDWIITSVKGEHYPCKPDIFAQTYEPVEAEVTQPADDDARLAEIRLLLTERPGRKLPPDTNKMRFLLRLLDEARAERDALARAMTEPSKWALEAAEELWSDMIGRYYEDRPIIALAFDAARRNALEEAARVADTFTCGSCGMDGKAGIAIRALIDRQSRQPEIDALRAALDEAERAIDAYLDGNFENPRRRRGKEQKCAHGVFYWQACEACVDAHFTAALARIREVKA